MIRTRITNKLIRILFLRTKRELIILVHERVPTTNLANIAFYINNDFQFVYISSKVIRLVVIRSSVLFSVIKILIEKVLWPLLTYQYFRRKTCVVGVTSCRHLVLLYVQWIYRSSQFPIPGNYGNKRAYITM